MRWKEYINPEEVQKAISVLQAPGKVFEVRAIGTAKKDILSGYFKDAATLLNAFDSIDMRQRNIYITLGEVKEDCFARAQSELFLKVSQTSSDTDIDRYRWLFVDLDPVRTAGVSSTNEELQYAKDLLEKVLPYMAAIGFAEPVQALSGNGYHLLYRIDIENDDTGQMLIEKCLKVLAELFNTEKVKIDTTNSNPSRICKLHGTLAQKGRSTADRPHRMSKILTVPEPIIITERSILQTLADELPSEIYSDNRRNANTNTASFDLLDFMQRNHLSYQEDFNDRATIYKLDECPFDSSHKDGDAKIFQYKNGAIAFKCHHNSCRHYKWQDVRRKYEPEAYSDINNDDDRIDEGYRQHLQLKQKEELPKTPEEKKKPRQYRKLKSADALMKKNLPDPKVFIGVDAELPILTEGTCILSAKPKLGKSWFALAMCIAVAKGEDFIGYKTNQCATLYLDLETSEVLQQKRLRKVLRGADVPNNFYLETSTYQIGKGFVEQLEHYLEEDPTIGIVVIDVFQIIRSASVNKKESEYEHAYRDITPLNEVAQKHHISIILVCHDRKAVDPDDPFANILGSTGLQGAATQMMVMFRKKKEDPIHISIKGKTIDGLPELNVKLEQGEWSIIQGFNEKEREHYELEKEYQQSDIRKGVLEIAKHNSMWKGRCGTLIQDVIEQYNIGITESPKEVGGFLHRHQGRFLTEDKIKISIIQNGTGPKIYKIEKFTIDTIDGNEESTIDEFIQVNEYNASDNPFL